LPLPYRPEIIEKAVETALEKSGALTPHQDAMSALDEAGADVRRLATELANLVFTARDATKLKAIQYALEMQGIVVEQKQQRIQPVINIAIQGENTNLQNLFVPERKF
jgi:hypothetical protein